MNTAPPRLETAIRAHFAPLLRREGFTGSGRTFRRVVDEAIHVVNVQGFWFGGSFAVNLSVHPLGLPCVGGAPADPKKITEEWCEFRHRLTEGPAGRIWSHDGTAEGMAAAVVDAAEVFEQHGLAFFGKFYGPASILRALTPAELASESETLRLYSHGSTIRLAYTFARVRQLRGRHEEAAAFARWALSEGAQPPFEGYAELRKLANDA
ncbi:DUF4304 domain-containing protein [Caldimonas mangrovi]|uniref:DUF4304 domain-containing protein n=1 Tax=Caldimonas mangrovi TaxID=2944811 RepID=UPI0034A28A0B